MFKAVCKLGLEGIVFKKGYSTFRGFLSFGLRLAAHCFARQTLGAQLGG
jgi:hypothetical protein